MSKELSKKDFIERLVNAGWSKKEAKEEWERIQNDTEADGE